MSLSTMTNDLARPGSGKQTMMAVAYNHAPASSETTNKANSKAFDAIAKFIPTEVLAPYIVVVGIIAESQPAGWSQPMAFFVFLSLTPLLLVLFEFAKAAEQGLEWPAIPQLVWRATAAMAAFAIWSMSVPASYLHGGIEVAAITGLLAVLVSPVLAAIDLIVMRILAIKS